MGYTQAVYDVLIERMRRPGPFLAAAGRTGDQAPGTPLAVVRNSMALISVPAGVEISHYWVYDRNKVLIGDWRLASTERFVVAGDLTLTLNFQIGDRSLSAEDLYDPADTVWDDRAFPNSCPYKTDDEREVAKAREERARPASFVKFNGEVVVAPPKALER